jgi:hypothetical protein
MKLRVILRNGQERYLVGIDDAEVWTQSFIDRGTSRLGDWLEVAPVQGGGRAFVRASDVVVVDLIDDGE